MLRSFLKYYKPYKKVMFLLLAASNIKVVLELFFPYIVKEMLSLELPEKNLEQLFLWCGALVSLYLGQFGINYFSSYTGFRVSAQMENDMRRDLFAHLQQLSFSYFDKNKSGNLLSRITSDLTEMGELATKGPSDILVCVVQMLGTMGMLLYMNPRLGTVIVALLLVKMVHMVCVNLKMRQAFYANRVAQGEMTARAAESLNGVRLTKAFAAEEEDRDGFMATADAYVKVREKSFRLRSYFMGSMMFFSNFINIAILLGGGILIHRGVISFSEVVAYFLYVGMFMKPLMQLMGFTEMYQRGMAGFRRFYEVMQEQPEVVDAPIAVPCEECHGSITFENVDFGYTPEQSILKDFNLHINPGETVAFVGATGAGKTTIANLLLRFYDAQKGRILVDGVDIKNYEQTSLRRQIGLVQQDVYLFSDSIRNNIAYGKLDASDAEIAAAAHNAAADSFIEALPAKYATEVGERGVKLSGGQKQRLSIARAFLKNAPILVLDEATSALDNRTEQQIQYALDKLSAGRTTLIIAHRLSTIKKADKIVVLQNGRVVECGSHQELLLKQGVYYNLYTASAEEEAASQAA